MKKLLVSLLLLMSFVLVACDGTADSVVEVQNATITGKTFTADIVISIEIDDEDYLTEIVTTAVYSTYNSFKEDFGVDTYSLYFTVYLSDSEESIGSIAYKVNASLQKPGLSYISDTLKLPLE